jgi:hypothetical protein
MLRKRNYPRDSRFSLKIIIWFKHTTPKSRPCTKWKLTNSVIGQLKSMAKKLLLFQQSLTQSPPLEDWRQLQELTGEKQTSLSNRSPTLEPYAKLDGHSLPWPLSNRPQQFFTNKKQMITRFPFSTYSTVTSQTVDAKVDGLLALSNSLETTDMYWKTTMLDHTWNLKDNARSLLLL